MRQVQRSASVIGSVAVIMALATCAPGARTSTVRQPDISISGVVVREDTGRPLANVRIRVYIKPLREAFTDSLGHYRIDPLPRIQHEVVADGIGWIRETRSVEPACTVGVEDGAGRALRDRRCTDPNERLNFSMRPQVLHP